MFCVPIFFAMGGWAGRMHVIPVGSFPFFEKKRGGGGGQGAVVYKGRNC